MAEREQLAIGRASRSRKVWLSGGLSAGSLGDLQDTTKRKLSPRLCQRAHRWRESRWSRECSRCGFVELKG